MLFSCKISNSIITFFEHEGHDINSIYENIDLPYEFLRDSSYWIQADKMEVFLKEASNIYENFYHKNNLLELVGHYSPKLNSWGVLDSVVRMMSSFQGLLAQPERFFSYFISPEPPLANLHRDKHKINFDLPISVEQFPFVTSYLKYAFESLPSYIGKPFANVQWESNHFQIEWSDQQQDFFSESEPQHNLSPDLIKSITDSLEKGQKDLELKNKELLEKNLALEKAKQELESHLNEKIYIEKIISLEELANAISKQISHPLNKITNNIKRMKDYLLRSHQLIILLIGQDRLNPAIKNSMKKVDWDWVISEYPGIVEQSLNELKKMQHIVKDLSLSVNSSNEQNEEEKSLEDINIVISDVLDNLSSQIPSRIKIENHFFMNKKINIYKERMKKALVHVLKNAIQAIDEEGSIRIITRPHLNKAQIEVSDTGYGMDEKTLKNIFTPFFTTKALKGSSGLGLNIFQAIIKMHQGDVTVSSKPSQGTTFLIEIPC